ncbi:hypothetical protein I3843_09G061000 [Carya illinoinensis]|nr:hypothetical protein I3843_09G061000 [Carya illinoinensis]
MGFALERFVLLQLTVLMVSCYPVFGEEHAALPPSPPPAETPSHHHHHHAPPPSHPPVKPPSHPPVKPPSHPPAHPPTHHHHHHGHPPSQAPAQPPNHHHHHHGHPPSHSPVHPPPSLPPPHLPPSHPPVHPPSHPPHHHSPSLPPLHPPVHPPAHPPMPAHPPAHPPVFHPPRSFVAVQGVVYCKSCKYAGADTLLGASPVLGAIVKLQCNNTKYGLIQKAKTDKNGYFYLTAPKSITSYGAHKCKVFLVSSPVAACSKPSNLHYGLNGALLKPEKPFVSDQKLPFILYSVGPFAFEPKCPH